MITIIIKETPKIMEALSKFFNDNHISQFFLAILIITFYFITYQSGNPSQLLELLAGTAIAFFFVNTSTSATSRINSSKLDRISLKLDTQELKAQSKPEVKA